MEKKEVNYMGFPKFTNKSMSTYNNYIKSVQMEM